MATDQKSSSKGQAWFCTTGLPSDIVIEVDEMTFHLHKFPLMSKSRKLHLLITEQEETNNSTRRRRRNSAAATETEPEIEAIVPAVEEEEELETENDDDEEEEEVVCHISFPHFPGSSETFETAAKFCYGVKIELSSSNVAPLRCAGEYLEMTEEYSEENLISKTERFLTQSILRNIKECLKTLKSCETLNPLSESINITQRCIDSIAERASSADPSLFSWPMKDNNNNNAETTNNQILWNGIDTGIRRKHTTTTTTKSDSWIDDLAHLSLPLYNRLISAMKARDLNSEIIENTIISYAKKSIPGLSRSTRKPSTTSSSIASETEQRELLESIITNLPLEKNKKNKTTNSGSSSSSSSTMARFLFGLLRTANILSASEISKAILERKIASQLEHATLDDLLIPSYSYLIETLYDVDCVGRILGYFLEGLDDDDDDEEEEEKRSAIELIEEEGEGGGGGGRSPGLNPVMLVGKLIDGYLSEIASDANLKPENFCDLGVVLPDEARVFDDGLYRAVDVYLKAHPWISEAEREKVCGVMDFQKLTLEACTHAAQNERLPLRVVVQVLFFEQLQLRHAIAGSLLANDLGLGSHNPAAAADQSSSRPSSHLQLQLLQPQQLHQLENEAEAEAEEEERGEQDGHTWRVAIRENQVLRLDMDSMRSRVQELEKECCNMKKVIEKIDNKTVVVATGGGGGGGSWKSSLTKKLGCKFKTQVCDSHEPATVVQSRKGGRSHHQRQTNT